MTEITTIGLPTNINLQLEIISDYKLYSAPNAFQIILMEQPIINYKHWMQNGRLLNLHENQIAWPNNPYQYVFGDRIVSSCMLHSFSGSRIKPLNFVGYKPLDKLSGQHINKNSSHCGDSLEDGVAENYGITTTKLIVKAELRFFQINEDVEMEVLDGSINSDRIPSHEIQSIMSIIHKRTTLDFFALDCLYDGSYWYLSDLNTFPGTSDNEICKKIAMYIKQIVDRREDV